MTCLINGGAVIITLDEQLDFRNTPAFMDMLQDHFCKGKRKFILDFSATKTLDSAGLRSIYAMHKQLKPLGGKICFASVFGSVRVLVGLAQLDQIFPQFDSVEAALNDTALTRATAAA